jgi:CBS domain-containing protein
VKKTLVQEVMTTAVVTASVTTPYRHLVALLYAKGIGAVPITGPAGQVLGVVSSSDLTAKAAGLPATGGPQLACPRRRRERRKAMARTARELMSAPAITVTPAATIEQAARIMRQRHIGRLPVTHPLTGRLAGIVTRSDLLRIYLRPGEEIRAEIEAGVLPRVHGADPRLLMVSVRDGVVTISGQVERRSAVAGLVRAAMKVEGVVQVDKQVTYDVDDRYPTMPA